MSASSNHRCTRAAALVLLGSLASACGLVDAGDPRVLAHRFGGSWPQNSRMGLRDAVARGYPGLEFDLVLTRDRVPVITHDASLSPELCTQADGTRLAAAIPIKDLSLAELQAGYRCGGLPDPTLPQAQVAEDTLLTLDELIDLVTGAPDLTLHFDVKYEPGLTLDAEAFADEILGRWRASGLPNAWYLSSSEPEEVKALRDRGAESVILTLPYVARGDSSTLSGLGFELLAQLGVEDAISRARKAGASGLNIAYQVTDRRIVDAARQQGLTVHVWTPNSPALLDVYCRWPIDVLITDYPERAPCL